MSPADGGMILGGALMVGLIAYGIWHDYQQHREIEAARRAKAYEDLPSASSDVFEHETVPEGEPPLRWDDDVSTYDADPDVLDGESPEAYTDRTGIKMGQQPPKGVR